MMYRFASFYKPMIIFLPPSFEVCKTALAKNSNSTSGRQAPCALLPHKALEAVPEPVGKAVLASALPAWTSVPGLWVELCANILDDLGDKFVQVVKLIYKEGVVAGRVSGDDFQLVLCSPCDTYRVGGHSCGDKVQMKPACPPRGDANEPLPFCCSVGACVGMHTNSKWECSPKHKQPLYTNSNTIDMVAIS